MPAAYSVSLRDDVSATEAVEYLKKLLDPKFRKAVAERPDMLYEELGLEFGEGLKPDRLILPTTGEIQDALDILEGYREFRFKVEPFGFYTPVKNPFIGLLLLAARSNGG